MTAADLARLRAAFPNRRVDYFASIDSTMLAAAGKPAGSIVVADEQTAGQGRHGRSWHSPAGSGIYLSIVLEPQPLLTMALGLAAAHAIRQSTGAVCDLRWPNDLMLGEKKLAGILVQLSGALAVAGIGINLRRTAFPPELEPIATSLEAHAAAPVNAADLSIELLRAIGRFLAEPPENILKLFAAASSYASGRRVTVDLPDGRIEGTTAGLDAGGFLIVRKDDGTDTLIVAGGVRAAGS